MYSKSTWKSKYIWNVLKYSTSTEYFPEMYLSTFQALYKLYLSTDVLKAKLYWISSDTHQLQLIKLHHLKLEIF